MSSCSTPFQQRPRLFSELETQYGGDVASTVKNTDIVAPPPRKRICYAGRQKKQRSKKEYKRVLVLRHESISVFMTEGRPWNMSSSSSMQADISPPPLVVRPIPADLIAHLASFRMKQCVFCLWIYLQKRFVPNFCTTDLPFPDPGSDIKSLPYYQSLQKFYDAFCPNVCESV
jgi:hypothetical protein